MESQEHDDYDEVELSPPEPVEQRRYPRLRSPDIDGKLPQRIGVRLVDISVSGVGLESQVPLAGDIHYRLVFDNDHRHIERDAALIWNRLDRTSQGRLGDVAPVYRSGFSFAPGDPGAAHELMLFMREAGPSPKRKVPRVEEDSSLHRAATRYALTKGFKLFLDAEPEVSIELLSRTGLRLQTRLRLIVGTRVNLFLRLPAGEIEAIARVVSQERLSTSRAARYRVALEFVGMSEAGRADLARYLDDRLEERNERSAQVAALQRPNVGFPLADSAPDPASPLVESATHPDQAPRRRRAPAGWILPTLATLLGLGVLLTSVSAEAIRDISGLGAWVSQHATALSWTLKAFGASVVGVVGYLGLRWLLPNRG